MDFEPISFFGLSEKELPELTDKQLEAFNDKMVFVRDAMPGAWLEYAKELKESAETLWKHRHVGLRVELSDVGRLRDGKVQRGRELRKISSVSRPYILLAGFALENLIKGVLVASDPSHVNKGRLSKELKSHNLLGLISKIPDFPLTEGERHLCKIAQDAIPYWGRYPIPLEYNGVLPEVAVDDNLREAFLCLHSRLSKRIYDAIRDGWASGVGAQIVKYRNVEYGDAMDGDEPLFE